MYFCSKQTQLIIIYKIAIQLASLIIPIIGLFNKKVKKGVTGRKKTLPYLKNNLNQKKLYEVIKNGAAGSWQFTNRYKTIIDNKFNFGFSTKLMEKDLRYVLKQSNNNKLNLKLTKNVYGKYKKLQKTKFKNQDTSSLIKSL